MVLICTSSTTPVNPPGTSPALSHEDLWTALVLRARYPERFSGDVASSRFIREIAADDNGGGSGSGFLRGVIPTTTTTTTTTSSNNEVEEEVRFVGRMKVTYKTPKTSQSSSNIISVSAAGQPEDLYLTFTFEWPHPGIKEGSEEARTLEEKYAAFAREVVVGFCGIVRGMKVQGG